MRHLYRFIALLLVATPLLAAETYRLDIKPQPLAAALQQFAEQSGLQIVYYAKVAEGQKAGGVSGTLTVNEALQRLLANTGLRFESVDEYTVAIRSVKSASPSGARKGTAISGEAQEHATTGLRLVRAAADPLRAGQAQTDEEREREELAAARAAAAKAEQGGELIVTGSRLRGVDPIAPVITIDRAEIERRGALTAEEVIRTLPQNFAATNTSSTTSSVAPNEFTGGFTDFDAAGVSAANLRGLGEASTLVLLNGRRTAGTPLGHGQFVNLSTIPTSDIERIEIVTQGASALYGADAVGGVINIILRKHRQTGAISSVRYDTSEHGKERVNVMQVGTLGWSGGNATATLNYTQTDPINPQKAGYTTNDFRSRDGSDRRGTSIFNASVSPFVSFSGLTAPDSYDGVIDTNGDGVNSPEEIAAARALFTAFDRDAPFQENLATEISPDIESYNVSLRGEQSVGENVQLYGFATYNLAKNTYGGSPVPGITVFSSTTAPGLAVPADNPYNPFGTAQTLRYTFYQELADGLVPDSLRQTEQQRIDGTAGLTWNLPFRDWQLDTSLTRSEESTEGLDVGLLTRNSRLDVDGAVDGRSPVERLIQGDHPVTGQPLTDRSDFINLFGNGTVQTPLLALASGKTRNQQPISTSWQYSAAVEGFLGTLPGGEVRSVLGLEYRDETIDYSGNEDRASKAPGVTGGFFRQLIELNRDSIELFNQTSFPLFGPENRRAGIESLLVNVAARWSDYSFNEPTLGSVDADPGTIDISDLYSAATFSNVSPGLGISWRPIQALNLRANWTENFRTPIFTDLVGGGLGVGNTPLTFDDGTAIRATSVRIGNPGLKPETSDNFSLGFDWTPQAVPGLYVSVTWQRIDTDNAIGSEPIFGLSADDLLDRGQLIEEPSDRFGWRLVTMPINLDSRIRTFTDMTVRYDLSTVYGRFTGVLDGTYFSQNEVNITDGASGEVRTYRYEGTNFGPNKIQARGQLLWDYSKYTASLAINYGSSYTWYNGLASRSVFADLISRHVPHYTTVDLTGSYETASGLRIVGGVTDLTDEDFPFVDEGYGFNTSKVNVQGRTLFLQLQKSFAL